MEDKQILKNREAVNKLQELAMEINVCLFCSGNGLAEDPGCRPMSTHAVDNEGAIWFFSDRNSEKNRDIRLDPRVKLFYSHPGKSSFLIVAGDAEILTDRERIRELWSPLDKTWFKEGEDDPDITIIKVSPDSAHYWDTKGNSMVNFIKRVASAATGKTFVKGEEGDLQVH
jgi:general stress protein 26